MWHKLCWIVEHNSRNVSKSIYIPLASSLPSAGLISYFPPHLLHQNVDLFIRRPVPSVRTPISTSHTNVHLFINRLVASKCRPIHTQFLHPFVYRFVPSICTPILTQIYNIHMYTYSYTDL